MTKILAAIPVYNEEDKIGDTIRGLKLIDDLSQIVVINDGSTDKTLDIVKELDVDLINFERNKGKGKALKEVFSNYDYDYICLVDGDLGMSSVEIRKLIRPVVEGECDFTIAEFPRKKKTGGFGLVRSLAKSGIKFYTGKEVDNSLSGQRVYKKSTIDQIKYIPNNFGIEVAMTAQAINLGDSFKNIPVNMSHSYTGKDLKGFVHRGKQFWHILKTFIVMFFKGVRKW